MQPDHIDESLLNSTHQELLTQISTVLKDPNVQQLLLRQLQLLPQHTYTLYVAFAKIYIILNYDTYLNSAEKEQHFIHQQLHRKTSDVQSKYAIKITKGFPLRNSVKLHLLEGSFQPKISDNRDLFQPVMGKPYHHSIHLMDIFKNLIEFDNKLHAKNQKYLEMQSLGIFTLGQKFYYQELSELFSSILLMKNINEKKQGIYVGLTQTHVLIFQECQTDQQNKRRYIKDHRKTEATTNHQKQSQRQEETTNQLQLICYAQMQCIDTIYYRQAQKQVRVHYRRYQSIKLYHQFQQIKKQYRFRYPEVFLRGILKCISKFQNCQINFQPYRQPQRKKDKDKKPNVHDSMVKIRQMQRIHFYIDETHRLQQAIKKETTEYQQKKDLQQIQKYYRKLIEHYSARTNPYYLIFVSKLNSLFSKYFIKDGLKSKRKMSQK